MTEFDNPHSREAHFSKRVRAGKRTYYFDVKATRGNDYYLTITESKRIPGENEDRPIYEKHKLFLYKEDFDKFSEGFHEALDFMRQKRDGEETTYASVNQEMTPENTGYSNLDFDDLGK